MTPDRHEWRLITRAAGGDGIAFSSLYNRYLDASYRYFFFRVGSIVVAEQLTDRLFLRVWEALPSDPRLSGLPFKLWLLRFADQVVADYNSYLHVHQIPHERPPLVAWSSKTESSKLPPLHRRFLALAVRNLQPLAQQVVVLRFLLRLTPKEVALVTGDTAQGAYALQYRALTELCQEITRRQLQDDQFTGDHIEATNYCLDHIINGAHTVEGCLEHLDQYNQQLKTLLQFGQMVVNARRVRPRRAFQRDARARISQLLRHTGRPPIEESPWTTFAGHLLSRVPPPILMLLSVLLIITPLLPMGLYAINRLTPSSPVYRLDLGVEQLYLAALSDPQKISHYRLSLTEERLQEAEAVARAGDLEGLQTALLAYMVQVSALSQELASTGETQAAAFDEPFSRQERRLNDIMALVLPPDAQSRPTSLACPQAAGAATWHPVALAFIGPSGAAPEELRGPLCAGYSFGELVLALATARDKPTTVSPGQALERRQDAGGWGQLWWSIDRRP